MTIIAGFTERRFVANGVEINAAIGGKGPPLLLIHGYPQTHAMWHKIAPELARTFTVVAPDLRGYGDSDKPSGDIGHENYAKSAMAQDLISVMRDLGFNRFAVAGHDRGGRVAYRMALDHPLVVSRLAVLDIVPTKTVYDATDRLIATHYYHWFFLIQPAPFPETLIGANPDFFLDRIFGAWSQQHDAFTPEARAQYYRAFGTTEAIHASCEDYRAGAGIDSRNDAASLAAGIRIAAPLLVLWGNRGLVGARFDVLTEWRKYADDVQGFAVESGHFLPEEAPEATCAALLEFLSIPG